MSTSGEYRSPLVDRYLNPEISRVWSEEMRMRLLSGLWTKNHNAYMKAAGMPGLVIEDPLTGKDTDEVGALIARAKEIELDTKHELVALLKALQETLPDIRSYMLHTGLTSSDVLDQCTLIQTIWSLAYLFDCLKETAFDIVMKARAGYYDIPLVGRTHLQPAEPTTLLHRFALFIRELVDWMYMTDGTFHRLIPYLGLMSGSVGTYGNIVTAMVALNVQPLHSEDTRPKSQTLPRYLELYTAHSLEQLAACLHKLAFDFRLEAGYGSLVEKGAETRVGSSAMPYKKNPIRAEKIDSLCRHTHHLCSNAWDNAAWQGLERTLDDSANRRMFLPEAFLTMAEAVYETKGLISDFENIQGTDPAEWYDLWSKSRGKSWVEARMSAGKDTDNAPPFLDNLAYSIDQDKRLMNYYVTMKWPGGDLQYLDLTSPLGLLNEFRWDSP